MNECIWVKNGLYHISVCDYICSPSSVNPPGCHRLHKPVVRQIILCHTLNMFFSTIETRERGRKCVRVCDDLFHILAKLISVYRRPGLKHHVR